MEVKTEMPTKQTDACQNIIIYTLLKQITRQCLQLPVQTNLYYGTVTDFHTSRKVNHIT